MKKLLFSLSLVSSLATLAGESTVETTAQVFGVLPIYSTASNVIVSVPWVASSNTETNKISVAEIVKTSGLTEGDWIRSWNQADTNFNVWVLTKNETTGVLEWTASKTVTTNGVKQTSDSKATYLSRGDALLLYRQFPTNFYVWGQYKALSTSDTTTMALGTANVPAYTLVAPPKTEDVDISEDIIWSGTINEDDRIFYGESSTMGKSCQPRIIGGALQGWGKYRGKTFTNFSEIPAGIGFWYVSRGGSPTIQWKKN